MGVRVDVTFILKPVCTSAIEDPISHFHYTHEKKIEVQ